MVVCQYRSDGQRDYILEYAVAFDAQNDEAMQEVLRVAQGDPGLDLAIGALHAQYDNGCSLCEHLQRSREAR